MPAMLKACVKRILPACLWHWLSLTRWRLPPIIKNWKDLTACAAFVGSSAERVSLGQRMSIVRRLYAITFSILGPHTNQEIVSYIKTIASIPRTNSGVVVEAGCYKGISTAKFSLAAAAARKELVVFDSFQGIPENDEPHDKNIFGESAHFACGDYCGTLDEVKANVSKFGEIDCCRFIEGWFDETLPGFHEKIAAIYLDVDLASSTRTCIKYLYPLLESGGVLFSQDGHLPLVIDVLEDDSFWLKEVGCPKPRIFGLGKKKLVRIVKE